MQELAGSPSTGSLDGRPLAMLCSALHLSGLCCDGFSVLGFKERIARALWMAWNAWREILWSSGCDDMISLYVSESCLYKNGHRINLKGWR